MLMKTPYLTANELDLTEAQYEGLLKTLDFLRNSKPVKVAGRTIFKLAEKFFFSMHYWAAPVTRAQCGTAHCIGGTAEYLMKQELWANQGEKSKPINELFYPDFLEAAYLATPSQAADALEYYLRSGNPRKAWQLAIMGW